MSKEFIITNDRVQASISSKGGELKSLKIDGVNLIWCGDEKWWGKSAPILFPIIGFLKNGIYEYEGKEYSLPKHGFLRDMTSSKIERDESKLELTFDSNDAQIEYPFHFSISIGFKLLDSGLDVRYTVQNLSSHQSFFTMGSHPAINLFPRTSLDEYDCIFDKDVIGPYYINHEGLIDFSSTPLGIKKVCLSEKSFENDALIFKSNGLTEVLLVHRTTGRHIRMSGLNQPFFALWAPVGAPFICLEPWQGVPDELESCGEFTKKESVVNLMEKTKFEMSYQLFNN